MEMAKDTKNSPDEDPGSPFDPGAEMTLDCAVQYAKRNGHGYITVEHVLVMLLSYIYQAGLLPLSADNMTDIQDRLRIHLDTVKTLQSNCSPDWAWSIRKMVQSSVIAVSPHQVTRLDFVQAIFQQKETLAAKLLQHYGLTSATLARAVQAQTR